MNTTFALALPQLALIEVRGADAEAFLQGQLSNDVRRLTVTHAQLSSFNSPKGRMLAVLHLLRAGDSILIELHRSILEPTLKRLRLYVLRSKVTLAESASHAILGIAGPEAPAALAHVGLPVPGAPLECAWDGDRCVTRRLGSMPRYTVLEPAARAAELATQLAAQAAAAGDEDWQRSEIEAGVPTVYPETQDHFVAQMCSLDSLGGISFDKGCYTGQEVVARVHYRGAVKRHMSKVMAPQTGLTPGSALELPGGRSAEVVMAAPHPGGGSIALVVAEDPGR